MERAENKASRLLQIETLLLAHPEGLTQAELARRLQVDRSTINRYLADLPASIYIDDDGTLKIDRQADLINLQLNLHEAMALHLASRLLTTRMDKKNPHAASALRKLGLAMERWAKVLSQQILVAADIMDGNIQRDEPNYIRILELLTEGWANLQKIKIWHRSERLNKVFTYTVSPYFIEPYPAGQTIQLVCFSEPPGAIRTYKIERIERAEKTIERYSIPEHFDLRNHLAHAWGIWNSDDEPVHVVLKFKPKVVQRIKESRWHPSQKIYEQEDGYAIWEADIAETIEMLPWIRGWGADCEVVEPKELRETLVAEAKKLAKLYGIGNIKPESDLIAHRRERDGDEQTLLTHLFETSQLAGLFAAKVGLSEIGRVLGLIHDYGKASKEFQDYLRSATGITDPDADEYVDYDSKKGKIDHSTAGAQLIFEKLKDRGLEGTMLAQFLALAIVSHHSGLIDCLKPDGFNEFARRINKDKNQTHVDEVRSKLTDTERQLDKLLVQPIEQQFAEKLKQMKEQNDSAQTLAFKHGLLARFLFSCLLEADRLNTADFENPGDVYIRNHGNYIAWDILIERLEAKFTEFTQITAKMEVESRAQEVNDLRSQVAQACFDAAKKPKGIYQLTVPTGGGKTLASLRFALHHAKLHGLERVFYIVPYITIIDQNADTVRDILEKDDERGRVVLEHHSNFVPSEDTKKRHHLLAENWDAPIVFTTQVQFLEALFGSGTRDARRMHQLANSVIIFDEVQSIPIRITHMFTTALRFLTHDCGASIVLCTATQPPFNNTGNPYRELNIPQENHIIQNEAELFQRLKRVQVHDGRKPGGLTNTEIADLAANALREKGSVLIVVNTRASALALYQEIKARKLDTAVYHLSTNMCPAHRMDKLNEIKELLTKRDPVICVSTQLIEAGVDIDFGSVIRALAGLDSIAQSAGRCNRHGLREDGGAVWVVNVKDENLDRLRDIKIGCENAQQVLDNYKDDPNRFAQDLIGLDAINEYYNFYYQSRSNEVDYPISANSAVGRSDNLFNLLSINKISVEAYKNSHPNLSLDILLKQSFRTANEEFQVIDAPSCGIIVPYKDGKKIITDLCSAFDLERLGKLLKQAQRYSVNLFVNQMQNLLQKGVIQEVQKNSGIYVLNERYYSDEYGWSYEPICNMTLHIV